MGKGQIIYSLICFGGRGGGPKLPFPERLADERRPSEKYSSDGVNKQTNRQTDRHGDSKTELAQWANLVKNTFQEKL